MRWFAVWALAGALCTLSYLGAMTIGVLVFPFALVAVFWAARRAPTIDAIGFVAGVGTTLLLVAFVNRDHTPCPPGGLNIPADAPRGTSVSCGGMDPMPWFVAGLAVVTSSVLAYAVARRFSSPGPPRLRAAGGATRSARRPPRPS